MALAIRKPGKLRQLKTDTPEGQAGFQAGRLIKGAVYTASGATINVMMCYGWQGAYHDPEKARRTDALILGARLEERTCSRTPTIITGDLNAKLQNLATLQELLQSGDWIDVGAQMSLHRPWRLEPRV